MKKQVILFALVLLPLAAIAQDIEVKNADGITIYYNYINDTELEVTYHDINSNDYSGNILIPESVTYEEVNYNVTSIGKRAFHKCSGLTSVIIPNSVMSIEEYAFYECSGLTSVIIPNSVTNIGNYAFWGNAGLTSVSIGDGVSDIGEGAFSGCSGMTSVTIPNSVTNIGDEAFARCRSLTSVTIGDGVSRIGIRAFIDCFGLTSVNIGNSVTRIGDYAFCGCSLLTSIIIPNSVTSIGSEVFWDCSHLSSITIGNNVTSIKKRAFDGANISIVVSLIENPFEIIGNTSNDRAFSQNTFNNATLYVPVGTIEKYKATDGWKDFMHIEEGIPTGINAVENTKKENTNIYNLNGVLQSKPKKGIYIINGKKFVIK